jgi:hypothetical protein
MPVQASAQAEEAQQLLLNVQKLEQLRQILTDMRKGYQIVSKGYTTIKDISEGNFNLHQTFLDGLLSVSPAVRKYKRVADIIHYQKLILREYQQSYARFRQDPNFSAEEITYLARVYGNLIKLSLKNLDELTMVITASRLRMNDEERLAAIDRIFADMEDKLSFVRSFSGDTQLLARQRAREQDQLSLTGRLYGITP